jgi:tetratricopeptide (TPR) repeat protein
MPEEHYKKAQKLCEDKKYDAALDNLNDAIDINPDYAEAYLLRGECKLKGGRSDLRSDLSLRENTQSAIDDFDNAAYLFLIKGDTTSAEKAYLKKGTFQQFENIDRAIETFQFATRLNPSNNDAAEWLSMCYIELGDTLAALNVFKLLLSHKPADAKSYYLSAVNKIMYAKNKDGACVDLQTALSKCDSTDIKNVPSLKADIENLININCGKK